MGHVSYRPLSGVRPHVDFELRTLSETVAACFASERLLVRVSAQMLEEMAFEGALAHWALEGFHAAMVTAKVFA